MNPTELIATFDLSPSTAGTIYLFINITLSLFFGTLFGYERTYHGRAAGMRTYGLVCMVSAALTSVSGLPNLWYDGSMGFFGPIDPTRVIQGIVTGLGFLGAGIIMKDGLRISGLTTAASIWAAAAIGVLVGLGFYLGGFVLTLCSAAFVMWGHKLSFMLPSRQPIAVTIRFKKDIKPKEEIVDQITREHGYEIAKGTIAIRKYDEKIEWSFVVFSSCTGHSLPISQIAEKLSEREDIYSFQIARARN